MAKVRPSAPRDFDAMERRRKRAAQLFRQGKTQADVARELEVSRQSVSRWHAEWKTGGTAALRGAGRAGRLPSARPSATCGASSASSKGPARQRLSHRHVDAPARGRGDRGRDRRGLSPWSCLAHPAPDGLEPPASGPPGRRAQRRGDRALGQARVASVKKNARRRRGPGSASKTSRASASSPR